MLPYHSIEQRFQSALIKDIRIIVLISVSQYIARLFSKFISLAFSFYNTTIYSILSMWWIKNTDHHHPESLLWNSGWMVWRVLNNFSLNEMQLAKETICKSQALLTLKKQIYQTFIRPAALDRSECCKTNKIGETHLHIAEILTLKLMSCWIRVDEARNYYISWIFKYAQVNKKLRSNKSSHTKVQ